MLLPMEKRPHQKGKFTEEHDTVSLRQVTDAHILSAGCFASLQVTHFTFL